VDGAATNVTLSGLTITQGDGVGNTNPGAGGGFYNDVGGVLTLKGRSVVDNTESLGADLYNASIVYVRKSMIGNRYDR
jgi:hypothetical protein